jgi:hypothetical protein
MEESYMVATDITGKSCDVDLSGYPGTEGGYFYIYATDGVKTAEAQSPFINKPFTAPVIITEQKEIPKIKITEEIYFPTEIYDAQDGWLSGESVSWILDGGKEVSITHILQSWPYMLEPGLHTFKCVATNSGGLSAEKEFKFEIIDDESDIPNDQFRDDVIFALKGGYKVPVTRIDAPITRAQYSYFTFLLYFWINPDGLAYYDRDAIKDCGDDDYHEFFMDYLGAMKAPDGYFNPNMPVTQREAMMAMYQVYMLATNPGAFLEDLDITEEEVLKTLIEIGVIDTDGENAYQPDEKISKKLALVRIGRFDDWMFVDE